MNRAEFEARLQDVLDRRQSPTTDLELMRAAEANPELRHLLGAYELFGTLRRPRPHAPADMSERVVAAMREQPIAPVRRGPSWLAPVVAVAATLVIATSISFWARNDQGPVLGPTVVVAQPSTTTTVSPIEPARPGLDRVTRKAAANYRELAATTGQSWNSALSVVQPAKTPEAKPPKTDDNWLRAVPEGLRPLSNSTSGALYSLMRAVPGADDSDRDEY